MLERLVTCSYARSQRHIALDRWHAALVCTLRGTCSVSTDAQSYELGTETGPLVAINAGEVFSLTPSAEGIAVICQLDVRALRRILHDRVFIFSCDPTMRHQESYHELSRYLYELIRTEAQVGDYADFHRNVAELALVRCMLDGFAAAPPHAATRGDAFCAYLDAHYDEPLSLAAAAQHEGLSTEHYAKVFKREVGQTFHEYLTAVRLDVATEMLTSGNATVARVALEAGFPNVASFNQAFKDRHGTTPTRYRNEHQPSQRRNASPRATDMPDTSAPTDGRKPEHILQIEADARESMGPLSTPWHDSIGLGAAEGLSDARAREQASWLFQKLRFAHARVDVDFERQAAAGDWYELERCFDFLVDGGITPHVLFARRPQTVDGAYTDALSLALRHLANRYSVKTVSGWRFELRVHSWEQTNSFAHVLALQARLEEALRAFGVEEPLAGPGLFLDQEAQNLRRYLDAARAMGRAVPLVSIGCRPATPLAGEDEAVLMRTADRHYLRNQVLLAREIMAQEGYGTARLAVGGWRDSLEVHNIMNDSSFEGASILQTVLSTWDVVDSLCYNDALDIFSQDSRRRAFLSGAPGLLSRDGIPKPSYFAFDFLSRINSKLVFANEHALVSTNEMGNYQIVCHNCARLNAAYLATPEEQLDYQLIETYYEERAAKEARVCLKGVRNGTYLVKLRYVNEAAGSVGDEARRMRLWCMDGPSRAELEYLRNAAQPQMLLERHVVTNGVLEFSHTMASNEIAYFHVIYLY